MPVYLIAVHEIGFNHLIAAGQVFLKIFLQLISVPVRKNIEKLHHFTKVFLIFVEKQSFSLVFIKKFFFINPLIRTLCHFLSWSPYNTVRML